MGDVGDAGPDSLSSMTHSSLIRQEANDIATQISLSLESSSQSISTHSLSNGLDTVPSLSSSFIDGAVFWGDHMQPPRQSPSFSKKLQDPMASTAYPPGCYSTPPNGFNHFITSLMIHYSI